MNGVIHDLIEIIHDRDNVIAHMRHDVRDSLCYPKMLIDMHDLSDASLIQSIQACLHATEQRSQTPSVMVGPILSSMGIKHKVEHGFRMSLSEHALRLIISELTSHESSICVMDNQLAIYNAKSHDTDLVDRLLSVHGYRIDDSGEGCIRLCSIRCPSR